MESEVLLCGLQNRLYRLSALILLTTIGLTLSVAPGYAQGKKSAVNKELESEISDPEWLREKLEEIRKSHRLPALAAAFVVDGKVVAASSVGVRKWGSKKESERDDAFHLGSVAKPMTAVLIARMVEQKKIRWEMTLEEMFPELVDSMQPAYRRVSVAHLLSHSSGMPYQPHTPESVTDARGSNAAERRYAYVQAAVVDPPEAEPGTKVIYSGGGVIVVSYLEKSLGQSYEILMQKEVFEPLGMTSAGFGAQATPGHVDGTWDHELIEGTPRFIAPDRAWKSQARAPVGRNVHCSVIDLAKFEAMHLKPDGYLSAETLEYLESPVKPVGYGPGWSLSTVNWAKGKILWHSGSMGRNLALAHVIPEEGFATAILTNIDGDGVHEACDEVNLFLVQKFREGAFK